MQAWEQQGLEVGREVYWVKRFVVVRGGGVRREVLSGVAGRVLQL